MSATSGIAASQELVTKFTEAIEARLVRFLKVSIRDESLVYDLSLPITGSLQDDLSKLQDPDILEDTVPAYVLAKRDEPTLEWLAIFYVPDAAKVRDKMLYAATRTSLLKSLGSTLFTDTLFATSKADLTREAYASHLRHLAAPKPLSAREQELADLRAAENTTASYEGSRARTSHIGTGVGLNWSAEVEEAVTKLGSSDGCKIVVIGIEPQSETLILKSSSDISVDSLGSSLPTSEPCYALFAWPHAHVSPPRREIVFIYSCPSSSPIKHRMLFSSGSSSTFQSAKALLQSSSVHFSSRKVETSDPKELDEAYLKAELGLEGDDKARSTTAAKEAEDKRAFAKPRGPARRR